VELRNFLNITHPLLIKVQLREKCKHIKKDHSEHQKLCFSCIAWNQSVISGFGSQHTTATVTYFPSTNVFSVLLNFFSWHKSPLWARASSLSRLHGHTQTHHTR